MWHVKKWKLYFELWFRDFISSHVSSHVASISYVYMPDYCIDKCKFMYGNHIRIWSLTTWHCHRGCVFNTLRELSLHVTYIDGILSKGPFPPCLRMADRALLAGYPRYVQICISRINKGCTTCFISMMLVYIFVYVPVYDHSISGHT